MGVPDNSLSDLERQRLELEDNIAKLQQSIYHWRTWEAEYDGLKEGIQDLDDYATGQDFLKVSLNFEGTLVNNDEVRVIVGEKQGVKRTKQQVIDLISRRIDYVKNNLSTMEKRLRTAEKQLHTLVSVEQIPDEPTADFPMTEIIEELDENGEVISSSTTTPGDEALDLLEILKKAGVQDIPDTSVAHPPTTAPDPQSASSINTMSIPENKEKQHLDASQRGTVLPASLDNTAPDAQRELAVVDVDESPEEAKLRREMLQYGLNEIGAVVAELELDENASDISLDDEYDSYTNDEDEEEDEFGRTRPILNDDYHQKMRELEAKLNARGLWNAGKDIGSLPENIKEDLGEPPVIKIGGISKPKDELVPEAKPKKKVAFADELDIAPAPQPSAPERTSARPRQTDVAVLSESVIERTETTEAPLTAKNTPKKASRFKTARSVGESNAGGDSTVFNPRPSDLHSSRKPATNPSSSSLPLFPARPSEPKPFSQPISDIVEKSRTANPPKDKLLADTLVERDTPEGVVAPEPDELDEQLHRKEIATEFYRLTNRMIQQNGGFLDDEHEEVPVEVEDPPQRVSKFRAARMR